MVVFRIYLNVVDVLVCKNRNSILKSSCSQWATLTHLVFVYCLVIKLKSLERTTSNVNCQMRFSHSDQTVCYTIEFYVSVFGYTAKHNINRAHIGRTYSLSFSLSIYDFVCHFDKFNVNTFVRIQDTNQLYLV